MHVRQLRVVGLLHEPVQRLRLAHESAAVGRLVNQHALADLPRRLVQRADLLGDLRDALDAAGAGDDLVLHVAIPDAEVQQVVDEVLVDQRELAGQRAALVDVARDRLKALVVAEDLRRARGRHRREQQRVAHAPARDLGLQRRPVPAAAQRALSDVPHVVLQQALRSRRARERRVRAAPLRERLLLRQQREVLLDLGGPLGAHGAVQLVAQQRALLGDLHARRHGAVVDRLKDVAVQRSGLVAVKRQPHERVRVGQALHPDADRAVQLVRRHGLLHRVERPVNDLVDVLRQDLRDAVQLGEVKLGLAGLRVVFDHHGQRDGAEVARRVRRVVRILVDLRAVAGQDPVEHRAVLLGLTDAVRRVHAARALHGEHDVANLRAAEDRRLPAREAIAGSEVFRARLNAAAAARVSVAAGAVGLGRAAGVHVELVVRRALQVPAAGEHDLQQLGRGARLAHDDLAPLLAVPHGDLGAHELGDRALAVARQQQRLRRDAQVAGPDRPDVLLVALAVHGVLVQHVRSACLNLGLQDRQPQSLRLHLAAELALGLVLRVQSVKGVAVHVLQARRLVGAHERPLALLGDALHEQVRDPQRREQVAAALVLVAVVLAHLQERLHVRVPRLQVDREAAEALAALRDVARRVVVHAHERHEPRRGPVRAADVRAARADVADVHADAAGVLADLCAVGDARVHATDRVADALQEARGHLRARRARVEQRRRRVRELAARHHVVRLNRVLDVPAVDAEGDAQPHVLRALNDLARNLHEVAALQRLEPEVINVVVAIVGNDRVQLDVVRLDDLPQLIGDQRVALAAHVRRVVQQAHGLAEGRRSVLVVVADDDAARQDAVVRVVRHQRSAHLRGQLVQLGRLDAIVDPRDDALRDAVGVHLRQPSAEVVDALADLIKRDVLVRPVALENPHLAER